MSSEHPSLFQRLCKQVPGGELIRYLCVGAFNTLFGYGTFALILHFLNKALPERYLYLTVILASVTSTPLNITVAYFGYKFFVFRTKGRYLVEWLKCFAVYGTAMLPGLFALSALTRVLQSLLPNKSMAGYVAGAIVTGFATIYSFLGHKNITFKRKPLTP